MHSGAAYARHLKPDLSRRLDAAGLRVEYHRASGDRLYTRDAGGAELEVLDMAGGFGASLLGHNHPDVVARVRGLLEAERPFHVQGSVRGEAALLAARLSERVGRVTGREYVATLANSGAEAVQRRTGLPVDEVVVARPGTIPRTSSGKRRRSACRDRYLRDELAPSRSSKLGRMLLLVRSRAGFLLMRARRLFRRRSRARLSAPPALHHDGRPAPRARRRSGP